MSAEALENRTWGAMESSASGTLKWFLLLLCAVLWVYWLGTRSHLYRFALKFPGYFGAPVVGSLNRITAPKHILSEFGKMLDECKRHTICIWMGFQAMLLTDDPEVIEKILSSDELLNKSKSASECLNKFFGVGLLSSPHEIWHTRRKLINPSFNHKVLLSFLPAFNKGKNALILKLDTLVDKKEHKIAKIIQRAFIGMSVETTMGKIMKDGAMVDEDLAEKYTFIIEKGSVQLLLTFLNIGRLFNLYQPFQKTRKYLHNFVDQLIIGKLGTLNEGNSNTNPTPHDDDVAPGDVLAIKKASNIFIDQAIQLYQKRQISWEDIITESNTIVAASFETSSNTTFSTIVMLATHPDVQERLYEEIVGVFPDKRFEMDYEHMQQLPYLDRVINETMRLCPASPVIGRQAVKDTQLTDELLLPRDLQILISIFHLHRRTDIWGPNANKFDPDNFLPENLSDKHAYAFIPFSKGVRNCIGWRYALFIVKVLIAGLVRNFRFTTTAKFEDLQYVSYVSLKYLNEPGIEIHRR